jgi:hypothetical protein
MLKPPKCPNSFREQVCFKFNQEKAHICEWVHAKDFFGSRSGESREKKNKNLKFKFKKCS